MFRADELIRLKLVPSIEYSVYLEAVVSDEKEKCDVA